MSGLRGSKQLEESHLKLSLESGNNEINYVSMSLQLPNSLAVPTIGSVMQVSTLDFASFIRSTAGEHIKTAGRLSP